MLRSKPHHEVIDGLVVVAQRLVLLLAEVNHDARVHAGDTVEDGLGEIHLPLVLPRSDDVLHLGVGINDSVGDELLAFPDFFLIHGEDVKGLVEFYPLAKPTVFCVIPVYHNIMQSLNYMLIDLISSPNRQTYNAIFSSLFSRGKLLFYMFLLFLSLFYSY